MRREALAVSLVAVVLMATAADVASVSSGIFGQARGGCTCHGGGVPSASVAPAVSGLPSAWVPGTDYPITVSFTGGPGFNPGSQTNRGGFSLEVTGGNLSATPSAGAAQTSFQKTLATHTTAGNDQTSWGLTWNAPTGPFGDGNVAFYLATNSVNGNGVADAGDQWNKMVSIVPGPADETAPVITNVKNSTPAATSVGISWNTDDPSDSSVDYGLTNAYGSTVTKSESVTSHSVFLSGLAANTTYHFSVRSRNLNNLESASADHSFATAADSTLPFLSITRPSAGRVYVNDMEFNTFTTNAPLALGSTVTAWFLASDASGIDRIEVYVDTLAVKRADAVPSTNPTVWVWAWPIGSEAPGDHTLYAKAYDTAGNSQLRLRTVTVVPLPAT